MIVKSFILAEYNLLDTQNVMKKHSVVVYNSINYETCRFVPKNPDKHLGIKDNVEHVENECIDTLTKNIITDSQFDIHCLSKFNS